MSRKSKGTDLTVTPEPPPEVAAEEQPLANSNGQQEKKKPAVRYRLGIGGASIEVAVWENRLPSQYGEGEVSVYSVSVGRSYKADDGWKNGGGFKTQELAPLNYLLDKALAWILGTRCEDSSMPF
jgi:hypothetical protein